MKGLTKAAPRLERVRVLSRSARKHYGTVHHVKFNAALGHHESRKYWSPYDGQYRSYVMNWYIKKGDPVKEDTPVKFNYFATALVASGIPFSIGLEVNACEDPRDEGAPVYTNSGVKELVRLTIDLSCIPEETIDRSIGKDGQNYYRWDYSVEMTSYSASTKYELVYKGIRYSSVEAEYV